MNMIASLRIAYAKLFLSSPQTREKLLGMNGTAKKAPIQIIAEHLFYEQLLETKEKRVHVKKEEALNAAMRPQSIPFSESLMELSDLFEQ